MNANVQFVSELPFPETNALVYRELYEYEQLFRRLAHAALVAKAGVKWEDVLPDGLLRKWKGRLNSLSNRIYLNCENSRNPIWITTMEDLQAILTMDSIWPFVHEFSGYEKVAYTKGFLMVSASPLTRSSHHAGEDFSRLRAARLARTSV